MGYPTEQRLRILEEQVRQLKDGLARAASIEDHVFHGVVWEVHTESDCSKNYLKIAPYPPEAIDTEGNLTFDEHATHPLGAIIESASSVESHSSVELPPQQYVKVYPINCPPELFGLYFNPGDRVTYWRYSGTGENMTTIRGSYVTMIPDTSFWAKVELQQNDGAGFDLQRGQRQYTFTAVTPKIGLTFTGQQLQEAWTTYYCGDAHDVMHSGVCYNLAEVYNPGGVALEQIVRVYPVLIQSKGVDPDDMWQYFFYAAPDERWLVVTANHTTPGSYKVSTFKPNVNFNLTSSAIIASTDIGVSAGDHLLLVNLSEVDKAVDDTSQWDLEAGDLVYGRLMGPSVDDSESSTPDILPVYWSIAYGVQKCSS